MLHEIFKLRIICAIKVSPEPRGLRLKDVTSFSYRQGYRASSCCLNNRLARYFAPESSVIQSGQEAIEGRRIFISGSGEFMKRTALIVLCGTLVCVIPRLWQPVSGHA